MTWLALQNSSTLAYIRAFSLDEAHMTNMVHALVHEKRFDPQGFYNYGGGYYYPVVGILIVVNAFFEVTHQHVVVLLRMVSLLTAIGTSIFLYKITQVLKLVGYWKIFPSLLFLSMSNVISLIIGAHPDVLQLFYLIVGLYYLMQLKGLHDVQTQRKVAIIAGLAAGVKYGGIFLFAILLLSIGSPFVVSEKNMCT